MPETRDRWRRQLPHWEVRGRPHFVTIRCVGTLPAPVRERLDEIHRALQAVIPHSAEFAQLQRHYFLTCEKYQDSGTGFAPFTVPALGELFRAELKAFEHEYNWAVPHWVAMPNHVHLLLHASASATRSLRQAIPMLKGRFARTANRDLGRSGAFWQPEWFDHWVRDEQEFTHIVDYIRQNPVKAGLVKIWSAYPWVQ